VLVNSIPAEGPLPGLKVFLQGVWRERERERGRERAEEEREVRRVEERREEERKNTLVFLL
jgi:hypothetical protein